MARPASLCLLLALASACGGGEDAPLREPPPEEQRFGLGLERRSLVGRRFEGVELYRVRLTQSDLSRASFSTSFLASGDLRGVTAVDTNFRQTDLSRCLMQSADLRGADLREARLFEADLFDADLRGASLAGADVSRANLSGTHLSGCVLEPLAGWTSAALEAAACWDERTVWPADFTPSEQVRLCHLHWR